MARIDSLRLEAYICYLLNDLYFIHPGVCLNRKGSIKEVMDCSKGVQAGETVHEGWVANVQEKHC